MKSRFSKPVKITVCCDGHVSIMRTAKDKRLGAALPVYSADDVLSAIELIRKVCYLKACEHGGKTGTLIEPWAPNWPLGGGTLDHLEELSAIFEAADCPIEQGAEGTVELLIELHGHRQPSWQVWVKWDNGRSLSLIVPPDQYRKLEAQ